MFTLAIVFQTLSFIIYATSQDIGHYFVRAPPPFAVYCTSSTR